MSQLDDNQLQNVILSFLEGDIEDISGLGPIMQGDPEIALQVGEEAVFRFATLGATANKTRLAQIFELGAAVPRSTDGTETELYIARSLNERCQEKGWKYLLDSMLPQGLDASKLLNYMGFMNYDEATPDGSARLGILKSICETGRVPGYGLAFFPEHVKAALSETLEHANTPQVALEAMLKRPPAVSRPHASP